MSSTTKLTLFTDDREIDRSSTAAGIPLLVEEDDSRTGPASVMLMDPDVNQTLLDQHV